MPTHTKLIESATTVEEETTLLIESVFAQELTGKKWLVRILEGDVQGSSAFYSKELLESHADVVKANTPIYIDHKQPGERPERKAENLAGIFTKDSFYKDGDLYGEIDVFSDKVEWVKERAKAGVIELSITGNGIVVEESGRKIARTLDKIDSVDIVTRAGAGGKFIEMTESKSEKEDDMALTKEELTEALGNQATLIAESVKTAVAGVFEEAAEARKKELEESKPEEPVAPTVAEVSEALVESGLTATARKAVYAAVESGVELEEAITTEKARVAEILEEAKVTTATFGAGNDNKKESVNIGEMLFG